MTFFDTAELYGWGVGERLLGHALAPVWDEVVIATKLGFTSSYGSDSRPDHIREVVVDNSLKNLDIDTIDVLYQHVPDPEVPIEDVVGVMKEYVDAGKVKYLGLSNADEGTIRITLSQLALAWLLAQKDYVVPIPGSRNAERVVQNVASAGVTLTADDLARIAQIAPDGGVGGRGC